MTTRLVRELQGTGTVYRGDVPIEQSARYNIKIFQEFIPSGIGASEIPGMFSIEGVIENSEALPIGEQLKLATASSFLEFWVKDSNGAMVGVGFVDSQGKPLDVEAVLAGR